MNRKTKTLLATGAAIALLAALGAGYWLGRRSEPAAPESTGAEGLPSAEGPKALEIPDTPAHAAFWLDVRQPRKVRDALGKNQWLSQTLQSPLGRGFVGAWAGFLGTRGEDLASSFKGTVGRLLLEDLFSSPLRVAWFVGGRAPAVPAVTIPAPEVASRAAFAALGAAARRGQLTAERCPGANAGDPLTIERWVAADQAIYAAQAKGKLVLARAPLAVLHAACIETSIAAEGPELELGIDPARIGRQAQVLSHVLGLGSTVSARLGVSGDRLTPLGLQAKLAGPGRLGDVALSEEALKLVPAQMPVVLTLQLHLPESLTPEALRRFYGPSPGPAAVRQVVLAWNPRGDGNLPTEVALIWSRVEDQAALAQAFTGANRLLSEKLCNQLVFASSEELLRRLGKSCAGKAPSLANAAPAITRGLRERASVGLLLQLGQLLPQLVADGYWSDQRLDKKTGPIPKAPPAEIEAARKQLEALPALGFFGRAEKDALLPRGFGS